MKMDKKFVIACVAVTLAGTSMIRADDKNRDTSQTGTESSTSSTTESKHNRADTKFLEEAAKGGMAEIKMGELGQQKAQSDSVKQFAQKLVQDHQQANQQIDQLYQRNNMTKPTGMETEHQRMLDHLSSLQGQEFDKAFIDHAVKDHKKDIKKFEKEAEHGEDPAIRSFARDTLDALRGHLKIAQTLQENPNASIPELREPAGAEKSQQNQGQQDQQQQQQNQQNQQDQNSSGQSSSGQSSSSSSQQPQSGQSNP